MGNLKKEVGKLLEANKKLSEEINRTGNKTIKKLHKDLEVALIAYLLCKINTKEQN